MNKINAQGIKIRTGVELDPDLPFSGFRTYYPGCVEPKTAEEALQAEEQEDSQGGEDGFEITGGDGG